MIRITRRHALGLTAATAASAALRLAPAAAQDAGVETHGLSTFGDLALPPDFPHFPYVDPASPKGGLLTLQIKQASGNQNFETFDTLNIFTF